MTVPKTGKPASKSAKEKRSYQHFADGSPPDSPISFTQYCREWLGTEIPVGSDRTKWFGQLKTEMDLHEWSWDDLVKAVAYIKREGLTVRHPYGVLHHVERAREALGNRTIVDVQAKVAAALGVETDPDWVRRLSLAQGKALEMVYENWRKERGGQDI